MAGVTKSMGRSALVLWLYASVAGLLTVGIYLYTKDTIGEQQRLAKIRALSQIVNASEYDNELLDDTLPLTDAERLGPGSTEAYIARKQKEAVMVILPVTVTDGYGGDMRMIVGVRANGEITGVRVLSHNETPGLGDKIDARKSGWIHAFAGRSLTDPLLDRWLVKKDGGVFDQFTGATITPRAVVKGVAGALVYFDAHKHQLLATSALNPVTQETKKITTATIAPQAGGENRLDEELQNGR